jgi:hypothetical protein
MSRNLFVTLFSEATTHNTSHDAHTTRTQTIPSSNAMSSKKARTRKKKREKRERDAITSEAIPSLPDHLVVAHVLRSEHSDDPADLARLPAVSHAMRGAVAKTGLRFEELGEWEAVNLGCLSAVKRLQRGGRLWRRERLCQAAARSGQLEELKVLRENGCPWNEDTCAYAAFGGQLEVLQWARAERRPMGREYVYVGGGARASRGAAVVARERLPVERVDVHIRGEGRAPRSAAVGARKRRPVGR